MFKLLGIFTCVQVFSLDFAENSNGGECSKFPCDHEIMKKIVELVHRYEQVEDNNLETAKILGSQDALIRSLQTEVQHAKQETKAKFAEQEDAITNNAERIEKNNASLHERWEMCSDEVEGLWEEVNSQGEQIEELKVKFENLTAEVEVKPHDCQDILAADKFARSGVYKIFPKSNVKESGRSVYCDMFTQGGGWIVFQRRQDGSEDFYRGWQDYKIGFGKLNSEFWLGLDNIHSLVSDGKWELLINMRDDVKGEKYALYKTFFIGPESGGYVLTVGDYSGDAGDSFSYHNGMKFSTKDRDNDIHPSHCSAKSGNSGAWWYKSCCYSNLNGVYGSAHIKGPFWYKFVGYNPLEFVEMKMRMKI